MNKAIITFVLACLLISTLSACSHLTGQDAVVRNYNNDYRYAKSVPPLKMPAGVELANVDSTYPVPTNFPTDNKAPSLIPPGNPGAAVATTPSTKIATNVENNAKSALLRFDEGH